MTEASTQVILTLFIGETYVEAGFYDQDYINDLKNRQQSKKNNQPQTALYNQLFYLPHQSLKSIVTQLKKICVEKNYTLQKTYLVSRYLERLQNFRLGGSVAQIIPQGFENSVQFGNSLALSLANPSLIISKPRSEVGEDINLDIEQIKKINPDCDKIIVYDYDNAEGLDQLAKNSFQVFRCSLNDKSASLRKTMFVAGVSGTQKELFAEISELVQDSAAFIWMNGKWNLVSEIQSEQNCALDLYMSGLNFLFHYNQTKNPGAATQFHIDFDNWEILKANPSKTWNSPWGTIEIDSPFMKESLPVGPRQEILIDDTSRLQISKNSTSIETGPFIAGRSVKSVVLDLFSDEILSQQGLYAMIGSPDLSALSTKIKSQFKALENGQKNELQLSCVELKNLIHQSMRTQIAFDSEQSECDSLLTGNLNFLFSTKNNSGFDGFFWSNSIISEIIRSERS